MKGRIAAIVQEYVDAVVLSVRGLHGITEKDFRQCKRPMSVRARTMVIRRLIADGLTPTEICQFTGMKKGLVERRLYPEQRARGNELRKRLYRTRKAEMEARA